MFRQLKNDIFGQIFMVMEALKYCYKYPRPSVTTDCVIFGYDQEGLSVLLIQRGLPPFEGCWAFPGGFLQMDEDATTGAKRELKEETGLETEVIEQVGTFSDVNRDPRGRVITIAHYALVRKSDVHSGDDAAAARWFPINDLPPLAFDHETIFHAALRTLKEKIHFKPIGFELLPDTFSMSQLQYLYECILGIKFDRRNFAAKMLKVGVVVPITPEEINQENVRPPKLYRFHAEHYQQMKATGFHLEF